MYIVGTSDGVLVVDYVGLDYIGLGSIITMMMVMMMVAIDMAFGRGVNRAE